MDIRVFKKFVEDKTFYADFGGRIINFKSDTLFKVQFTYVYTNNGMIHKMRNYKDMKTFVGDPIGAYAYYMGLPRTNDVKLRLVMNNQILQRYVPRNIPGDIEISID